MKDEGRRTKKGNGGRRLPVGFILLPSSFCLLFAGCASLPELPWAPVAKDASAGFYQTARIEYRVDAGKLGLPLDVIRVDGQRVNYEQIASSPLPEQSVGTLAITTPHPRGRAGYAQVTFTLNSSQAKTSESLNPFKPSEPGIKGSQEEIHEVWALDIASVEADGLFQFLSKQNFHGGEARHTGTALLSVTIDGRRTQKQWDQLTPFNQLVQRVRQEGQLVAYLRPGLLDGTATAGIASTQAFRQVLAQTQDQPPRASHNVFALRWGENAPATARRDEVTR